MRFRCMIAAIALACSSLDARAEVGRRNAWSRGAFASRALGKGAVYELRLRLPENGLEGYLAKYARWFLPVDQQQDSGRKLLSVLSREHGDQYNVVFLYWYESAYKHNYYCQYRKAFFQYHAEPKGPTFDEFLGHYQTAVKAFGGGDLTNEVAKAKLIETIKALSADCTDPQSQADLAEDTILQIDRQLARMIELDQGTWNFGVNLCQVAKIHDAGKAATDKLKGCLDEDHPSMLERAIDELEWPKPSYTRRP